jgi:excisionase family DNA binding protein
MISPLDTPLLSINEATKYLRLSTATLARMRRDKIGPVYIKMGSRVQYKQSDLDAYIKSSSSH